MTATDNNSSETQPFIIVLLIEATFHVPPVLWLFCLMMSLMCERRSAGSNSNRSASDMDFSLSRRRRIWRSSQKAS